MTAAKIKPENEALATKLFEDMWRSVDVQPDGSIAYPDFFHVDDYLPLLTEQITASTIVTPGEKVGIVRRAFLDQRLDPKKDFDKFLSAVDQGIKKLIALPETTFYMTTNISFSRGSATASLTRVMDSSRISLCSNLPKKLRTAPWSMNGFGLVTPSQPPAYAALHARTKARTTSQAARGMLADIELFVACLNLAYSSARVVLRTGRNRPLNRIRLGQFQLN
jgi:hypothetical protein